ncbi:hypothetical protein H6G89_22525 [Oscillatoria sp. FACHB-1407]|uniref:hypothetical protein n=1 Tax=Oscillatoria sp. FACHB-1407 TaxID=2692847 RepID=UPI0016892E12|nr:hypothetical protein [Oscillatoria sp. FACHB-1407]MBD2463781.1 hypothetical protein [Oscillatoria sp. FACHB-1407]
MKYIKRMQMQSRAKQWRGWMLNLSIASVVLVWGLTHPITHASEVRLAQLPPNQSDITGPDVGNPQGPDVPGDIQDIPINLDGLDLLREIIGDETDLDAIAQRISQALDEAYEDCRSSSQVTQNNGPRRFARGATAPICTPTASAACQRLQQLIRETRTFIGNQRELQDQIRANSRVRYW